jgi:hypothetical protein
LDEEAGIGVQTEKWGDVVETSKVMFEAWLEGRRIGEWFHRYVGERARPKMMVKSKHPSGVTLQPDRSKHPKGYVRASAKDLIGATSVSGRYPHLGKHVHLFYNNMYDEA